MQLPGCARTGLVAAALVASSGRATTLVRMDVDDLVRRNATVVVAEVVDVASRWNEDRTLILSDVTLAPRRVLRGPDVRDDLTITVMGGTVGDLSTVIVAGPELVRGSTYVVFLGREDLPGAPAAMTVRDLCQGIFDVVDAPGGPRAISQAVHHPLLADADGAYEAPGGREGLLLDDLVRQVRQSGARGATETTP